MSDWDICPPRDIQKELMDTIHKLREKNEGLKKKIEELQKVISKNLLPLN